MKIQTSPSESTKTAQGEDEKKWDRIYQEAVKWKSNVVFMSDEIHFFRILLSKYFLWLNDPKYKGKTAYFSECLLSIEKKQAELQKDLKQHLKNISGDLKSSKTVPSQQVMENHLEFKVLYEDLSKDFMYFKKEIFQLTKESKGLMKGDHLLGE